MVPPTAARCRGLNCCARLKPWSRRATRLCSRGELLSEAVFLGSVEQQTCSTSSKPETMLILAKLLENPHTSNALPFLHTHTHPPPPPTAAALEGLCPSSPFPMSAQFSLASLSAGEGFAWCCAAPAASTGGGRGTPCLGTSAPAPGRRRSRPVQPAWTVPMDPQVHVDQHCCVHSTDPQSHGFSSAHKEILISSLLLRILAEVEHLAPLPTGPCLSAVVNQRLLAFQWTEIGLQLVNLH